MEIQQPLAANNHPGGSPSSSSSSSSSTTSAAALLRPLPQNPNPVPNPNPMQSWWESISRARSRIQSLAAVLHSSPSAAALDAASESDRPARALLDSPGAYAAVSAALARPSAGSGDDPLCQWLYETYQSSDPDLRLVVLSFVPLLAGLYLSRVVAAHSSSAAPSLSGFEAVLLSLYSAETKARGGKPLLIHVPDLSQPSLYHFPRGGGGASSAGGRASQGSAAGAAQAQPTVGILSPPLEPQIAVKSTKRACIVAVALDCYFKKISFMPSPSKVDLCEFAAAWAGQYCSCRYELDQLDGNSYSFSVSSFSEARASSEDEDESGSCARDMSRLGIEERHCGCVPREGEVSKSSRGSRVPLPWELLQPVLRILGHCLLAPLNSQEVRDAASVAVRCVYARASHDLVPQAILASRSLIQLDKRARDEAAKVAANASSNPNTPSKPKKPEILLASK
ncbi:hypothetical protein Taro_046193 [Colocasia esculenta]|uniref:Hyccin n=1 Tax=Colocasia esculenta TaxID=4460 RepID=A0A843WYE7_COLES|nr:hypothetical protein [Colocasia esculenta]